MNFDKRFHYGMALRRFLLPVELTYTGPVTWGISELLSRANDCTDCRMIGNGRRRDGIVT